MFVEHKEAGEAQEVKPLDEVGKALLETAAEIERRGLPCCMIDSLGRGCVIITLGKILRSLSKTEAAIQRLAPHVPGFDIAHWSDAAGRDGRGHEVVAKLRAVALGS